MTRSPSPSRSLYVMNCPGEKLSAFAAAAQASAAFGVSLGRYRTDEFSYRGREGTVHLPADLVHQSYA